MGRVVAELGRPETPGETAARKAESSRIYRGSQTMRNLIAALIATVGVVLIIVLMVPRGEIERPSDIDVAAIAERVERDIKHPVVVPPVSDEWRVNSAKLVNGAPSTWEIIYAPGDGQGFLRVSQGLSADEGWASRELPTGKLGEIVTLDGIAWQSYTFSDPSKAGNISYALSTKAGIDTVLIFGSSPDKLMKDTASKLAPHIEELKEAAQ
ncbi:DUF4245 family protein [Microbacterium sp. NC79]|uniref:DUF4245 family protein n=1 Tax=Microbacterium sp. NC79 TaxID=2851009 RepID=UPI001C2BE2D0|nr:DUF4245 family protein [Microbacterium sp. NC79]MBV0894443.1 DUF4245 domain-containing protein [Microbacterium sp. NC79]